MAVAPAAAAGGGGGCEVWCGCGVWVRSAVQWRGRASFFVSVALSLQGWRRPVCAPELTPYPCVCMAIGRGATGWVPHRHQRETDNRNEPRLL
jgi:hypothetical protein